MSAPAAADLAVPRRPDPRHRLRALLDPGTVEFTTAPDCAGVQTARGRVAGAPVTAFAFDPGIQGGAMGAQGCTIAEVLAGAGPARGSHGNIPL